MGYTHVLLKVQKGDGVAVSQKGILSYVTNVIRPQIQGSQPMQSLESLTWYGVKVVVAKSQILQIFCRNAKVIYEY